jgi:hypothetical protein
VIVLVVGLVLVLLLNKATAAVKNVNASVKQTYTAGTATAAVATSLAPALGTFLSNAFGGNSKPASSAPIPASAGGGGSWDTSAEVFGGGAPNSMAFVDDTSNDYLLD